MVNLVVVTAKFMVNLAVWRVLPYKITGYAIWCLWCIVSERRGAV